MAKEGHLPPRDNGQMEVSAPMEHGTPSEILPVEMMVDDLPLFPSYLFLLVFFFNLLVFFCLDKVFATIIFGTPFKPKGAGTFLQL